VCFEAVDLAQRVGEIAAETDGAIVDEHVRRRLPACDRANQVVQPVFPKPPPHANRMTGREHDDVEAASAELLEECARPGARRIPVIGVFPARVGVEHAVQIDTHERTRGIVEVEPPHLE